MPTKSKMKVSFTWKMLQVSLPSCVKRILEFRISAATPSLVLCMHKDSLMLSPDCGSLSAPGGSSEVKSVSSSAKIRSCWTSS